MVRAEVSTTIKRPVEEVFAVMSDASRNPQWVSGMSEQKKTSDGPIGVGTTWHGVSKFLGRRLESDQVYTEFESNRRFTWEATTPFPVTMSFTFEVRWPAGRGSTRSSMRSGRILQAGRTAPRRRCQATVPERP